MSSFELVWFTKKTKPAHVSRDCNFPLFGLKFDEEQEPADMELFEAGKKTAGAYPYYHYKRSKLSPTDPDFGPDEPDICQVYRDVPDSDEEDEGSEDEEGSDEEGSDEEGSDEEGSD